MISDVEAAKAKATVAGKAKGTGKSQSSTKVLVLLLATIVGLSAALATLSYYYGEEKSRADDLEKQLGRIDLTLSLNSFRPWSS